jgi:hypothetical protein
MARGNSRAGFFMSSAALLATAKPVNARNVTARLLMTGVAAGQKPGALDLGN